jgi:subtilisin family serine protease
MSKVKSYRRSGAVLLVLVIALVLCVAKSASAAGKVEYVPGELLVKFKPSVPLYVMQEIHRGVGAVVLRGFRNNPQLHYVKIPKGWELEKALEYYQSRADVQYAQPNFVYHVTETSPNDPLFPQQWGFQNIGQTVGGSNGTAGDDVNATAAWDKARGRFTVVVASIDTGVDYLHPDMALNIWTSPKEAGLNCKDGIDNDANGFVDDCRGWNFVANNNDPRDDNGHGTHTSGIIGALTNNSLGVAGANWNVQIMPVKFLPASGIGDTFHAYLAIEYAINNGAMILNNSWGGTGFDPTLLGAIKDAEAKGVLFVASAGNTGTDDDNALTPFYPCGYSQPSADNPTPPQNIVCVAATDNNDTLASFSNFGATTVHLGAPGVGILSTWSTLLNQSYGVLDGTSQATAFVTGAAALLKGCKASLNSSTLQQVLLNTVRPASSLSGKTVKAGVVDYAAAINDVVGTGDCDPPPNNILPSAKPGGPYNSNVKWEIQFNGTPSSDPDGQLLIWYWNFGDGTNALGPRPTHRYSTPGTYTVTLTVRDNLGGVSSKSTTATIRPSSKKK